MACAMRFEVVEDAACTASARTITEAAANLQRVPIYVSGAFAVPLDPSHWMDLLFLANSGHKWLPESLAVRKKTITSALRCIESRLQA